MSSLGNAKVLRRVLEGALMLAAGTTMGSCCEVLSLGWQRSYGARQDTELVRLDAHLLERARIARDGTYDSDTCARACYRGDNKVEISGCAPVTVAFEARSGSFVHCSKGEPPYEYWRAVDQRALEKAEADRATAQSYDDKTELYQRVCGSLSGTFNVNVHKWHAEHQPVEPSPDDRFVVCHYTTPGGCGSDIPSGRKPWGLTSNSGDRNNSLASHFARTAYLEAASVVAFRHLALDLREHGAPRSLIRRCERARSDERRHARVMSRLAKLHGETPARLPKLRRGPRTLLEVAMENAAEGCVAETLGAAIAIHQSRAAEDPTVRNVMGRIAEDELRHAALAWAVHAWARTKLRDAERAIVEETLQTAVDVHLSASSSPRDEVVSIAGVPDRELSKSITTSLAATLWNDMPPTTYTGQ